MGSREILGNRFRVTRCLFTSLQPSRKDQRDSGVCYRQCNLKFSILPLRTAGPFIGGWLVARLDEFYRDFVTPGNQVEVPAGVSLGSGLSETESGAIALVSGTLVSTAIYSVDANSLETNSPQIGDDVIAEVTKLMPKVAMIRILHIEKDGG